MVTLLGCGARNTPPEVERAGDKESPKNATLEAGAKALQAKPPIDGLSYYIDGFHVMKDDPTLQMEAHHYCNQMNEDFSQCVIFDGNTGNANLIGVEYIISEKLYGTLAQDEQKSWHPHNYEILSGTLVAPGLPEPVEKEFLKGKMNSYGKTWHIWDTGHLGHEQHERVPLGPPKLAWSFNADGEMDPRLEKARDQRMKVDTAARRQSRQALVPLAHPQQGVDDVAAAFPERKAIAGVPLGAR
jgi:hypothetical protein